MAAVRRTSNGRFFVNAKDNLFHTKVKSKDLGLLSSRAIRDVDAPIRRLCCRIISGRLFVKDCGRNMLVCSVRKAKGVVPYRSPGGMRVGRVITLGTRRLLMTANKGNMCGLSIGACVDRPCVATGCDDCGKVGKGGVGSVCMSRRRHV